MGEGKGTEGRQPKSTLLVKESGGRTVLVPVSPTPCMGGFWGWGKADGAGGLFVMPGTPGRKVFFVYLKNLEAARINRLALEGEFLPEEALSFTFLTFLS